MFLNGSLKMSIGESDQPANVWMVPKNIIGTDDTKKIGLSFFNGKMNCTSWGYSTDTAWISANYPTT